MTKSKRLAGIIAMVLIISTVISGIGSTPMEVSAQNSEPEAIAETGAKSEPEYIEESSISDTALDDAIKNAGNGQTLIVPVKAEYMSGTAIIVNKEQWNSIIEKKLIVTLKFVTGNKVYRTITLNGPKMKKLEVEEVMILIERLGLGSDSLAYIAPVNIRAVINTPDVINNSSLSSEITEEDIVGVENATLYVGSQYSDGTEFLVVKSKWIVSKDMKRVSIPDATSNIIYIVKAGMLEVPISDKVRNRVDFEKKSKVGNIEEAQLPIYSPSLKYENGEILFQTSGEIIVGDVNVAGTNDNFTVVTKISDFTGSDAPIFAMDNRYKTEYKMFGIAIASDGKIILEYEPGANGWGKKSTDLAQIDLTKETELHFHFYEKDNTGWLSLYSNGERVYVGNVGDIENYSELNTFYNFDWNLKHNGNRYGKFTATNTVYSGMILPEGVTPDPSEIPQEEPADTSNEKPSEIPGDTPSVDPTDKPNTAPEDSSNTPSEIPSQSPSENQGEKPNEESTDKPIETESQEDTEKPSETQDKEPTENNRHSLPDIIKKEDIVELEKVIETAIDKITTSAEKNIEIVTNAALKLEQNIFEAMKSENKNLTIGVTDENNQLQYSWTFSNENLKNDNADMNIDLSIGFESDKKEEIEKLAGEIEAQYFRFSHHGTLPGTATIKTYVGNQYEDETNVYLYYYNEEENKILSVGDKALEVKNGYIEYTITHCSTYFVAEEKIVGVEKDRDSLEDPSVSVVADVETPNNGIWIIVAIGLLIGVGIAVGVFVVRKKQLVNK